MSGLIKLRLRDVGTMDNEIQLNDEVALLVDVPEHRLHRGDVGTVVRIDAPTRMMPGAILLEFASGTQTDIEYVDDIVKLNSSPKANPPAPPKQTLQEWVGESKMLALAFTDIVDSTTLANALGDELWIKVLQDHVAQARSLMSPDRCYEIKMIGDSFMVAFRRAVDALDFALAFQADTGNEFVSIRAGIHAGPVRVFENDLFGLMVNYTKRVESTNNTEFIVVSGEVKQHVEYEKASRHSSLSFRPIDLTFKGFDKPQKVWRVVYPELVTILRDKRTKAQHLISKESTLVKGLKKVWLG
jgi:class 3 adenylate cyclase